MTTSTSTGVVPALSENALTVLQKRYLRKDIAGQLLEDPAQMLRRVAQSIAAGELAFDANADVNAIAERFYRIMADLEFLPNSPTLMNAGRELGQLSACFVLPIGDSMDEIFDAVKYTALIHKSGGGTGFSFSRLRPANDVVATTTGTSSGPISFIKVFDQATEAIKQGGTRRGANMGILRVDHPDILEFINCKSDQKKLNNFNISVGLTEGFMQSVETDGEFQLINPRNGEPTGTLNARKVFQRIVRQAWSNGEPGIVFLDRLNRDNPTPLLGEIESTNPCGEQPLLPYESCNLGSINLAKMVAGGEVNWTRLAEVTRTAIRFLDNVIEVNRYPLDKIEQMTRGNRKIGLGVMGWADMLIELGLAYNSPEALELGERLMGFIRQEGHAESHELGRRRGSFPNWPGSTFDQPGAEPMRNATVTTIAPTGTISILASASSGIEPLFAVSFVRNVMDNDVLVEVNPAFECVARERGFFSEELMRRIAEHGTIQDMPEIPAEVRKVFVTAHDITPEEHIRMQAAFQKHTDNAVSKTVNFPSQASEEDVEKVYWLAFHLGCKGVTIYRDGSREQQVLSTGRTGQAGVEEAEEKAPVKRDRPSVLTGSTYQMITGCGALYITINEDQAGLFELFTTMGKAGGCASSQCEALGRMVSLLWRTGVDAGQVIKQLKGISCHQPFGFGDGRIASCADAVARAIEEHLKKRGIETETAKRYLKRGACPECGGAVEHEGGCAVCRACAYSECG